MATSKDAAVKEQQETNQPEAQKEATRSHPLSEVPKGYTKVQDSNGEWIVVELGMDGENPVSVENPPLKAVRGGQPERDESDKPSSEAQPQYSRENLPNK